MELTTKKKVDLQGDDLKALQELEALAGQNTYLNDGEGTVPNAEYRIALYEGANLIGFFSPYVYDLQEQRYWRAGPLFLREEYRGKGYMRQVLQDFFAANAPGLVWIDDDNASSIKLFVGLGFTRHSAHPAKNGGSGHWYTLVTPEAQVPNLDTDIAPQWRPSFYRW